MMEPVMANAGLNLPREGYLQAVRELTIDHGALLIFDEVITGMRVAPGGAQEHYLVTPDITVISKAVGGGYPVGAFGASAEIMDVIVGGSDVPRRSVFGQRRGDVGGRGRARRGAGQSRRHVSAI